MKVTRIPLFLFLLVAAWLCACSRQKSAFNEIDAPRHFNALKTVETLLETDPVVAMDSVNALKEKCLQSPFTMSDGYELRLREVQAQYKNRCLSDQSPDLAPAVAFFDSLAIAYPDDADLQYLLANAYYYNGAQCSYANEDVDAFTHYLNALKVMQQRTDWGDNPYAKRFTALIYMRLSEILYRYGMAEKALKTCREAASFCESDGDLAAMKRFEATIYQSQKDYDKALSLFEESEALAPTASNAMELSIGAKLLNAKQYDFAVPHLETAFRTGDYYARMDAAAKLAEICRDKGQPDEELSYTRYYVESMMMETRMSSRKMEIEYLFDEFNRPQSPSAPSSDVNRSPFLWILLLLLLVIVLMVVIIIRNRKRISHIENKITSFENNKPSMDDNLVPPGAQQVDFDEAWKAYTNSFIVSKIRYSLGGKDIMIKNVGAYPNLKLKEMDYIELVHEINKAFPNFSVWFLKKYRDLNVSDLRHGCLGVLGFNDAEIAVLEGISYSGANRRSNKMLTSIAEGDSLENAMLYCLKSFCN